MVETAQDAAICFALPDNVGMACGEINRLACEHLGSDIPQYAVTHVDGVVETDRAPRRAVFRRKELEHAFAAQAGLGIFADGAGHGLFCDVRTVDIDHRIDVAGRKGDNPAVAIGFGNDRRHMHVHRPGQIRAAAAAELAPGHEDDVFGFWQRRDVVGVEQIALDRLDTPGGQLFFHTGFGKAGDANDFFVGCGAFGHAGEGRAHLAADTEHDDIAVEGGEIGDERVVGCCHILFERVDTVEAVRKCVCHVVRLTRVVSSDFLPKL